jgi:hypothetical protein
MMVYSGMLGCQSSSTWSYSTTTDSSSGYIYVPVTSWGNNYSVYLDWNHPSVANENAIKEGVEMKKLYTVYLVYGADRDKPTVVVRRDVIAKDIEDAKVKSGIYAEVKAEWDSDYLTIYADEICDVKVKAKPSEVKTVDK